MSKVIMIGCDLHDAWMRLRIAVGAEKAVAKSFATADAAALIAWVKEFAALQGATRIVFAYEASGQGFGLYDTLTDAGIECYVLGADASAAHGPRPQTEDGRQRRADDSG